MNNAGISTSDTISRQLAAATCGADLALPGCESRRMCGFRGACTERKINRVGLPPPPFLVIQQQKFHVTSSRTTPVSLQGTRWPEGAGAQPQRQALLSREELQSRHTRSCAARPPIGQLLPTAVGCSCAAFPSRRGLAPAVS